MSEGPGQPMSPGAPQTTYRCFLFADLRGYTAMMDRVGNAAGAALLNEYLEITRAAVARHDGAEIKVEGDGFHAVFPSASGAVMCGLEIIQGATEANRARPTEPIKVGVGIHAGEAIETADGFIGSAVNIAARVCGAAQSGEALVTGTVRGITQSSAPVRFVSRGRQRLKGIEEPVELFAVLPPQSAIATPAGTKPPANRWLQGVVALGAVALGLLAIGLFLAGPRGASPRASASPVASIVSGPSAQPLPAIGDLSLGHYAADQFSPPFGFGITDPGWTVYRNRSNALGLFYQSIPNGRLDIARVDRVYVNPCGSGGDSLTAGTTALDLISAIEPQSFVTVSEPVEIAVGGRSGLAVEITVSEGAQAACGSLGGGDVVLFVVGDEDWGAQPAERFRLQAIDVDGQTVSIITSAETAAASSVQSFEDILQLADRVIDSIEF